MENEAKRIYPSFRSEMRNGSYRKDFFSKAPIIIDDIPGLREMLEALRFRATLILTRGRIISIGQI